MQESHAQLLCVKFPDRGSPELNLIPQPPYGNHSRVFLTHSNRIAFYCTLERYVCLPTISTDRPSSFCTEMMALPSSLVKDL